MKVKFKGLINEAVAIEAVKQNGDALQYVPESVLTEAMAIEAVKQDGYALQYVLDFILFQKIAKKMNIVI